MILVTVGTEKFQFNRLIRAVDEYCGLNKRQAFIQTGSSSYKPNNCEWSKFLNYREMQEMINAASVIVAHAGAGTLLSCISNKKVPLVAPRLSRFGEHVDDHQVDFAYLMEEKGLAQVINPEDIFTRLAEMELIGKPSLSSRNANLVDYLFDITNS
jgi:UDP-N-acetylglucosamine transferase subunit ALG13